MRPKPKGNGCRAEATTLPANGIAGI